MTTVSSYPGMSAMDYGRLGKALDRRYRFEGEVMTLGQFIAAHTVTGKSTEEREYSAHRIGLEYQKLAAPKVSYFVTIESGAVYEVPKIVWECITPESAPNKRPSTFAEWQVAIAAKLAGSGAEWLTDYDWPNWEHAREWLLYAPLADIVALAPSIESGSWNGKVPEC